MRALMILMLALTALTARAQDPALTEDEVARFVEAMDEIMDLQSNTDQLSPEQRKQQAMIMGREWKGVLDDHGFTPEEWARVSQQVFRAYASLNMEKQNAASKIEKARERVRNNPDLSEKARKRMLKQVEQQAKMMSQMRNSANTDVVKPYRDELDSLTE